MGCIMEIWKHCWGNTEVWAELWKSGNMGIVEEIWKYELCDGKGGELQNCNWVPFLCSQLVLLNF